MQATLVKFIGGNLKKKKRMPALNKKKNSTCIFL